MVLGLFGINDYKKVQTKCMEAHLNYVGVKLNTKEC